MKEISDGHFLITTRMPPENNMANVRMMAMLAAHYKVPRKAIRIVSGQHMPKKTVSINDEALTSSKEKEHGDKDQGNKPHVIRFPL